MSRGLDFEKAQAALKRAGEKAVHGTREERSGRFGTVQQRRASHAWGERVSHTDIGRKDKWRKS
jgi:hypothetical protein